MIGTADSYGAEGELLERSGSLWFLKSNRCHHDRQSPRLLAHHVDVEHVLVPEVGLGGQDPGDGEVDQLVDVTVALAGSIPFLGLLKE